MDVQLSWHRGLKIEFSVLNCLGIKNPVTMARHSCCPGLLACPPACMRDGAAAGGFAQTGAELPGSGWPLQPMGVLAGSAAPGGGDPSLEGEGLYEVVCLSVSCFAWFYLQRVTVC